MGGRGGGRESERAIKRERKRERDFIRKGDVWWREKDEERGRENIFWAFSNEMADVVSHHAVTHPAPPACGSSLRLRAARWYLKGRGGEERERAVHDVGGTSPRGNGPIGSLPFDQSAAAPLAHARAHTRTHTERDALALCDGVMKA